MNNWEIWKIKNKVDTKFNELHELINNHVENQPKNNNNENEDTVKKSELESYTKSEIDVKISDLDLKIRNTRYIKSIFLLYLIIGL